MIIIAKIASSILASFYQAFFYAVILALSVTLVYKSYPDIKSALKDWLNCFKTDKHFRWIFLSVLYTVMILFRTLLNRNMWENPLSNIIGVWGIYDKNGELTTQVIENFILFIPFSIMLLHTQNNKTLHITQKPFGAFWYSIKFTFLFSAFIEFTQLFFRLGTFQFSDFFYNTLGGLVGGLIYYIYSRINEFFMRSEQGGEQ